jgi:hypothetical protein
VPWGSWNGRELGRLAHVNAVDVAKAEALEIGRKIRPHAGAVKVDFFELVLELIKEGDDWPARVAVPGLDGNDPAGPRTYYAVGLVAAGFGYVDASVELSIVVGQNLRLAASSPRSSVAISSPSTKRSDS